MGSEDPYLNSKHAFYTTSWGDQSTANNDFDEVQRDGDRDSLARVTWDLHEHELVEIQGIKVHSGDVADTTGKFDVFFFNGQSDGGFWRGIFEGSRNDDMIYHHCTQVQSTNGVNDTTETTIWFPKPILNSGLMEVVFREGLNDVGEAAATVFYTVREFDENTVLNERLDQLM